MVEATRTEYLHSRCDRVDWGDRVEFAFRTGVEERARFRVRVGGRVRVRVRVRVSVAAG